MQTVAFRVPDRDLPAFMKLVETMPTVQRINTPATEQEETDEDRPPTKEEFLAGLREAVQEVKDIKADRKHGKPLKQLIEELRAEGL